MKGLHKQTLNPKKDATSWMKEDAVARGKKSEIRATTMIILRLIDYMERHQMTQTDLAHVLGVTPQYINKLIHGQDNSFRIETAIEYGQKLGIKLIDVPSPEEDVDYVFTLYNQLYTRLVCVEEVVEDYTSLVFNSGILKLTKKQKWTANNPNPLVTA